MSVSRLVTIVPALLLALQACSAVSPDDTSDGGSAPRRDGATPIDERDGGGGPIDGDGGTASDRDGGSSGTTDGGAPASCAPACGSGTVCVDGECVERVSGVPGIDSVLLGDPTRFDEEVLISQNPDLSWRPSRIYKWRDFVQAVTTMHTRGIGDMRLWLGEPGDPEPARSRYALVNLAAFLAQSMKETIRYDACDENNWDMTNGYAISNACGQLGQDYAGAGYDCEMACPRDPSMRMTAVTHAQWYGAPGPLFCAPNATLASVSGRSDGRTGRWNYGFDCYPYPASQPGFVAPGGDAWTRPQCEVYEGQRAGRYEWDGSGGSVEGCCWWGRGVIQTTGRCNFGMLNHYLGAGHLDPARFPRPAGALYPDVNFCRDPEAICASTEHPELKWIAGLFYWMSSVEPYSRDGWVYKDRLRAFVDGGMTDGTFIDGVSGIVNRGCHNPPCGTGPLDGAADRRANFELVLTTMGLR
ncbi:hypothetical protein [Sandaracinus amylolyticus]|uniref:hypothetical protein n=1 Tax=Sandaracinus amylolyticus TaxID=927083 RepID=UPI00069E5700|nr:hypothetical protein [Sandaracinus amylolyticus]